MASTMAADAAPSKEAPSVWLDAVGWRCLAEARGFVEARAAEHFSGRSEGELAETVLPQFLDGGKFLRPMFAYVGWRCGAAEQGWSGSADRFGEAAATLSGDLFLVWSEQLLRESGLDGETLSRGWPRYDAMRAELAVGQLADLVNEARTLPGWNALLDVLRRKSGNYTVRRPLEFGAALAGCGPDVLAALAEYGGLVGEAFQFKDDLLGVFGDPAVTGKPAGQDLRDRKASSVVVLAAEMADRAQRDELDELLDLATVDDAAVARWCGLITATGARERLGELIRERADKAQAVIDSAVVPRPAADALTLLATRCTERDQ
jgi:geranylgeranyl diphosphate synthase type I